MVGVPIRSRAGSAGNARSWWVGNGSTSTSARIASYKHLRRRGKKPNWRGDRHAGRGVIPGRVDGGGSPAVSERPAIVDDKSRVGDWEVDTVVGAGQSGALASAVERSSKLTRLARVERRTARETGAALERRLKPDSALVLTITADNGGKTRRGKEFAGHRRLSRALDADFYFARPYHAWERGLNEHLRTGAPVLPEGHGFPACDR